MSEASNVFITINNKDYPFTELFSLLKLYDERTKGLAILDYDQLSVMNQHIDNAITILLRGLQGVGQLIGLAASEQVLVDEISQIGFFISAIGNLTEALNDLRSDTKCLLKEMSGNEFRNIRIGGESV